MARKEQGEALSPPSPPAPLLLSLDEAAHIIALGHVDAVRSEDWLPDDQRQTLDRVRRDLIRALRSGQITARGKRSLEQTRHKVTGEWYYRDTPRDREWSNIPAACFEADKVDWPGNSINSREFTDVVLAEPEVAGLVVTTPSTLAAPGPLQLSDQNALKSRGRPPKYDQIALLALMAAILEQKGEPDGDDEAIGWLQEVHTFIYETEPSRSTIQDKVLKALKVARSDYARYMAHLKRAE